ncbi:MAG: hypothetical protein IPK19_39595 [Chloroflexi bacterium]|nr:hypothetical protein [Chloroflexota bacterium]
MAHSPHTRSSAVRSAATETGELPRVEIPAPSSLSLDPPPEQPRSRAPRAVTGLLPAVVDTADPAKFAEDTSGDTGATEPVATEPISLSVK